MDAHLFKGNVKRENVLFILKRTLLFALHDLLKNWGVSKMMYARYYHDSLQITKCNISIRTKHTIKYTSKKYTIISLLFKFTRRFNRSPSKYCT